MTILCVPFDTSGQALRLCGERLVFTPRTVACIPSIPSRQDIHKLNRKRAKFGPLAFKAQYILERVLQFPLRRSQGAYASSYRADPP
jgi:hypothetical protein